MAEITREKEESKFLKVYITLEEREELLAVMVALGHMSGKNYERAIRAQGWLDIDFHKLTELGSSIYYRLSKMV